MQLDVALPMLEKLKECITAVSGSTTASLADGLVQRIMLDEFLNPLGVDDPSHGLDDLEDRDDLTVRDRFKARLEFSVRRKLYAVSLWTLWCIPPCLDIVLTPL